MQVKPHRPNYDLFFGRTKRTNDTVDLFVNGIDADIPVREVFRDGTLGECYGTIRLGECFGRPVDEEKG